jgi:C4-dicarboxylate transporter DctM subunit
MFIVFALVAIINVPIAFALGLASVAALYITGAFPMVSVSMAMTQSIDSYSYMAIPFFILAGNVMEGAGISKRLVNFANSLVGSIHGGLAIVTVISSMFFGAISGSAVATVAAIGGIMIPYMVKEGYDISFSAAVAAAAGCLGLFIPPSIAMITYGINANQSIGAMFIGGIGPGIIAGLGLSLVSYYISRKRGYKGNDSFSIKRVISSFKDAIYPLLMPVIILGGIYGGVFTPTEAAAVAVMYAVFVGFFLTKELKLRSLIGILTKSVTAMTMIMLIVATATAFGRLLTLAQLPASLVNFVVQNNVSPIVFLLFINGVMLIVGTFMELNATILILAPLLLPLALTMGINPVHLGVIMVVNMTFGLITPPLGVNLFVACGITKGKFDGIVREIWPFIAVAFITILIVTYVPNVSMFLINVLIK